MAMLLLVEDAIIRSHSHIIVREKQLKAGSRVDKVRLINRMNPSWKDLSAEL
ncbi:MAG: hypothetical protein HYX87_05980 [Chloroflexi bacterium]|nr:hypothetical protein [Chloroflexota bacterium]